MNRSLLLATVVATFSAALFANVMTMLPAQATVTAGLAMTPARCRAVSAREHLTCHEGPLANRGITRRGLPQMTAALKKIPYAKPRVRSAPTTGK